MCCGSSVRDKNKVSAMNKVEEWDPGHNISQDLEDDKSSNVNGEEFSLRRSLELGDLALKRIEITPQGLIERATTNVEEGFSKTPYNLSHLATPKADSEDQLTYS